MKATTIIIAAALTLLAGILFAGNDIVSTNAATANSTITLAAVAPTTPAEATFEEFAETIELTGLAPAIPSEASFEDMPSEMVSIADLIPLTPGTADFDDAIDFITIDNADIAPATPAEADFE